MKLSLSVLMSVVLAGLASVSKTGAVDLTGHKLLVTSVRTGDTEVFMLLLGTVSEVSQRSFW